MTRRGARSCATVAEMSRPRTFALVAVVVLLALGAGSATAAPGVQYGLTGAGLTFCLYLFFTVKCEIRARDKDRQDGQKSLAEAVVRPAELVVGADRPHPRYWLPAPSVAVFWLSRLLARRPDSGLNQSDDETYMVSSVGYVGFTGDSV